MQDTWKMNDSNNNIVELSTIEIIEGLKSRIISPNLQVFDREANCWRKIGKIGVFAENLSPNLYITIKKPIFWWLLLIPLVNIPVRWIYQYRIMKIVAGKEKAQKVLINSVIADIVFYSLCIIAIFIGDPWISGESKTLLIITGIGLLIWKICLNSNVWGHIATEYNEFIQEKHLFNAPKLDEYLFNLSCWVGIIPFLNVLVMPYLIPARWIQLMKAIFYFAENEIYLKE